MFINQLRAWFVRSVRYAEIQMQEIVINYIDSLWGRNSGQKF